jgi:hypothetical protein
VGYRNPLNKSPGSRSKTYHLRTYVNAQATCSILSTDHRALFRAGPLGMSRKRHYSKKVASQRWPAGK